MNNLLLNIDAGLIDWSRAQFALTAIYHWLFVPLTLGLAVVMGIMETIYYKTNDVFWKDASRFWQKLFGVNFAMGVATGLILEFEFGTNWSNYSWFVGDIFGAPLAVEGIIAFFMEATFVAVMFFGWNKVSKGFHLASTWLTGLGATISAWWILVANSWMQYPIGCEFNPDTMRNEMVSFAEVALSPFAIDKFFHTVTSSWIVGAAFTVAVSGYYLLKKREQKLAIVSFKIGSIVGLVASLLALFTGDNSAYMVAKTQPMKLAAMEALYTGGNSQELTVIGLVNPTRQPDYKNNEATPMKIAIPNMLSILATRTVDGFVPGVNDIINGGYIQQDGTKALSFAEKVESGKKAITALGTYRAMKSQYGKNMPQNDSVKQLVSTIKANMPNFGYGYIKDASNIVPSIPVTFYAFRIMVGLGSFFILFFIIAIFIAYKKDITTKSILQRGAILTLPLAYIASQSGWIVAEMGRQPWAIQDMMPTWIAVSDLSTSSVMITFFIFFILFTILLIAEIKILCSAIKKGPEYSKGE